VGTATENIFLNSVNVGDISSVNITLSSCLGGTRGIRNNSDRITFVSAQVLEISGQSLGPTTGIVHLWNGELTTTEIGNLTNTKKGFTVFNTTTNKQQVFDGTIFNNTF